MECDAASLLLAAKCFGEIPPGVRPGVRDYLLCQWANNLCPEEALTYIAAAGITNATDISAVCQFVTSLKNTGTPSFWSRQNIIYPMIGPNFVTGAGFPVNLKAPGTNNFTPNGTLTYSARGIQGDGSTGYLDTTYTPGVAQQNDICLMVYVDVYPGATLKYLIGVTAGGVRTRCSSIIPVTEVFSVDVNNANSANVSDPPTVAGVADLGAYFIQRVDNANKQSAFASKAWKNQPSGALAHPGFPIFLLALNNGGAAASFANARISGFSLGSKLTDPERLQYKTIWDTFQNSLSTPRSHP